MTSASYITSLRILLIKPIAYLISNNSESSSFIAFSLLLIAGTTDYLDGYVARKPNTVTELGALLDLVADKLLICLLFVWLLTVYQSIYFVIPVMIILFREITISYIRQFLAENKNESKLRVRRLGKSKTIVQFIAISMFMLVPVMGQSFHRLAFIVLWTASILSLLSLVDYFFSWKNRTNS